MNTANTIKNIGAGGLLVTKFILNLKPAIDAHSAYVAGKTVTPEEIQAAKEKVNILTETYNGLLRQFSTYKADPKLEDWADIARKEALETMDAIGSAEQQVKSLQIQYINRPKGFLAKTFDFIGNAFNLVWETLKGPIEFIGQAGHFVAQNPYIAPIVVVLYGVFKESAAMQTKRIGIATTKNELKEQDVNRVNRELKEAGFEQTAVVEKWTEPSEVVLDGFELTNSTLRVIKRSAIITPIFIYACSVADKWLSQLGQNSLAESLSKAWPVAEMWVLGGAIVAGIAIGVGKIIDFAALKSQIREEKRKRDSIKRKIEMEKNINDDDSYSDSDIRMN